MTLTKKDKLWSGECSLQPDVEQYTVGNDYLIDSQHLVKYDCLGSIAHVKMLGKIGVLSDLEVGEAVSRYEEIVALWEKGEFKVLPSQEDCHTAIEMWITEKTGDLGQKIHTGRSRNDQSMTMIRLFMKAKGEELAVGCANVASAFGEAAKKCADLAMPGYTHMQKAMPTSPGTWLTAYADAFKDVSENFRGVLSGILDQNPLGSAAGFGINHLQIDREETTRLLGLSRTQNNPIYCALSRGMFEGIFLSALAPAMTLASRFAADFLLFSMQETNFFFLAPVERFTTGSSIMPQKRNYDVFEVMRANSRLFLGRVRIIEDIIAGLPGGGYHRDLQLTKEAFVHAVVLCEQSLSLLATCVPCIEPKRENLEAAMTDELFVTDQVYLRVAKGQAFRSAYADVKAEFFQGRLFPN